MTGPPLQTAAESQQKPLSILSLSRKEFSAITDLARREFGVELGPGKEQLVAARLGKLMRRLHFSSFREFYDQLQADRSGGYLVQLIDSLTTNHTSFFREQPHFDFLVERIFARREADRPLRIWSAACSSGEEPYTIALVAQEYFAARAASLPTILASDISTHALDIARKGTYPANRLQQSFAPWLRKHLLRGEGRWEGWFRMRPEIMSMIEFRRVNLIESFPDLGRFDVIFCRNVMIYFSHETQSRLIQRFANTLNPGGYLFVGHSETLTGMQHGLEHIQPAIYRKRGIRK
ncbi:CheR family methyltransferase [Occallatibacter savannae]|uniref:CheR family methyltransferase n=1 Tax=Occallatibacter savannae TaxID=1002691 RepID=UPI000D691BCE|nr:protein-glutamate O-methyltransferase [Occallatibacter savannae]